MSTAVDELTDLSEQVSSALADLWAVIVLNDDVTTFQTVIDALMQLFGHDESAADALAWRVHREGRAVVHVATEEEATQGVQGLHGYGIQATMLPIDNT